MPLGDFEREVLRPLAANRNPDSFVGRATVLHQGTDTLRRSEDIDIFHDLPEALQGACEADTAVLQQAGLNVEWVQDAAFRFFPVEPDLDLGWRLNFWDAATNKVLAMAGRQKIRDFLDCLYLHERHLHLGALVWASAGKDPGLTPEFILDWALRGNRFFPEDLADVRLGKPIDLVATKQAWFGAVQEARSLVARLPAADLGCFYLDSAGHPVCPNPDAPGFAQLTRHFGTPKGTWPRIAENPSG